MSQQHLKLTKNSQSAAQAANSYKDNISKKGDLPSNSYQDQQHQHQNQQQNHQPATKKSKGEVQTFQKKLQRRDLNLIPPSAAIVQSLQHHHEPRSTTNDNSNNRSGFQLTVTSTKNKNGASAWDHIDHQLQSRVTTVKHEKGLPNGTIMQCLKQFQRSKQQRQANHQTNTQQQDNSNNVQIVTSAKGGQGMTLNQVIPVASQNVANMPISTKSNKSHQTTKTRTQIANNASMAAEALAQRRQNFTCTTTTKGSIRLTKKSPSNGRDQTSALVNHQNRAQHQQQQRDRSSNANKVVSSGATQSYQTHKNARGSTSQQHNTNNEKSNRNGQKPSSKKNGANPEKMLNDMDFETKFAMLMRIREERSNESKPELLLGDSQKMILMPNGGPYEPIKLISPNTTTNRQSSQETKLLTLKNFQPAKQVSSNIVTPKYLKCKLGGGKQIQVSDANLNQHDDHSSRHDMNYSKVQSKSQISTQNVNMDRHAGYKTTGISPDNKGAAQARIGRQSNQTKSLSNNSRQKYASQQQQQSNIQISGQVTKIVKPLSKGTLSIKHRDSSSNAQKPTAPQMRYSQPPEQSSNQTKQTKPAAQAQQQVQSSSSALNGSSELQKRFTRGEIGSHHEASVSSGKANKSFQFGHNTALMSCSSGGDSSNPPQPVRRRSSSGKNGKQIKISHIQNVNPVIIQPGTSTSASIQNNDNSYNLALQKQIPQSTTNNQKSGKRFTFATMGRDQQKASRPNKHSNNYQNSSTKNATNQKHLNAIASHQQQQHQTHHNHQQHPGRDPSTQKSASKGKSVSAKKGKGHGVNAAANSHAHATNQHSSNNTNSNANNTGKNLNFDKPGKSSGNKHRGEHKIKVKTPDEMWYEQPKQSQVVKQVPSKAGQVKHSIPVHQSQQQPSDNHHTQNQRHQKLSNGSTPRSQLYPKDSKVSRHKKERISEDIVNMSYGDINQRDSVADESSQDISAITQPPHREDFQKLYSELQQKDNLIQQLYQALGRKEEQLNALSLNCEVLSTNLKARDEKRDKSQQAIKETLKSLEEKLQMFTAQSQHNKGGLQQITTHSPYETNFLNSQMSQQMPSHSSYAEALDRQRHYQHQPNQTPNMSSAQRMEPYKLSYQNSTQPRPASGQLLQVPLQRGPTWDPANRRPSQISEIDSLVTVAEYNGTQYDGFKFDQSNYELSATKKDAPFIGEGTIGSLASEIQIINSKRESNLHGHNNDQQFPVFQKNGNGHGEYVEELGEMTSVSEMEISNVHDASLDQLERDLMDTQQKLQEQSQKAAAFVKTQQNNFIDLKASMQAANERHAIQEVQEDTEEAEDDIAQLIPRKSGSQNLCQTQKVNLQKIKQQMSLLPESAPGEERKEMLTSTTTHQLNDQSDTYKSTSLGNVNSISHNSYQTKTSKTLSKNKMKLKLAAEILGLKKDQVACASDEEKQVSGSTSLQRDNKQNDSREKNKFSKKKIQLPLKIQKGLGSESNRLVLQSKSQERGTTGPSGGGSGLQNSVINSVTIRNIKNSVKISTTMEEHDQNPTTRAFLQGQAQPNSLSNLSAKSPQSRQGGVQVQGQGNMLSNRLSMKGKPAQPQVQKLDKLMADQLVLVSKLQHGQRTTTASGQTNFLLDAKAVPRKERRH